MVGEADILVGIYGFRYGYIPRGEHISVTEMEFQAARSLGKEILVYVKAMDSREPAMGDFLRRVEEFERGLFRRPPFKTTEELAVGVKTDLLDLLQGPRFHLYTFKEYVRRLSDWTLKYWESSWGGRYTELSVKSLDFALRARRRGTAEAGTFHVSQVMEQNRNVLIVGEAGSGKTTALLHLLKVQAERVMKNETSKVPVFVPLNAWTEDNNLESLILASLSSLGKHLDQERLRAYLEEGRFMLAFDGINEIPARRRAKDGERDLGTFVKENAINHIVVTTRPIGYNPKMFETWPIYEILSLDRDSIRDFSIQYLGDQRGRQLFHRLGGNDDSEWQRPHSLITLARNPLFLWMFIETNDWPEELANDKATLIKRFVDYILQTREQGKASQYSGLAKKSLLRALAFEMNERGEVVRVNQEKGLRVFSAAADNLMKQKLLDSSTTVPSLVKEICANGLITLENETSIYWTHQVFQEFFGALELAARFDAGMVIGKQLNSADWKESVVMAASIDENPEQYINEVMSGWRGLIGLFFFENPRALLAINCVSETRLWHDESLRTRTISIARSRIASGLNQRLMDFGETVLGSAAKPFSGFVLRIAQRPIRSYYVLGPILWLLGVTREPRSVPLLARNLMNSDRVIRWVSADALRRLKDRRSLNDLIQALADFDGDVRWQAIQAIINIGDPRAAIAVAPLLNHPDPNTRWAAAFALGKIGNEANLASLENLQSSDHTLVWWGETVSQAAGQAITEIHGRLSHRGSSSPPTSGDMLGRVYG